MPVTLHALSFPEPRVGKTLAAAATLCACLLPFCAAAKGDSVFGTPTPALVIYAAQLGFAHDACAEAGMAGDAKASDTFIKNAVERGLQTAYYTDHVAEFGPALATYTQRHREAWATMAPAERQAFCVGYRGDVDWSAGTWRLPVIQKSDAFRSRFSPPSQQQIDRAKKANFLLAVLSLGATTAGINQTRQHDFSAASDLNDAGRALAGGMGTPGAARGSCDAYAPFEMMNRAVTAGDFRRYHSIVHCDAAP